jgi:hypothetical protein
MTTTKVLAVALLAIPACKPDVRPEPAATSASAAQSAPVATAIPSGAPVASGAPEDPKLVALREDLANTKRDQALAKTERFRPLCDKDGYPLVGNLVRKAPGEPGLEPSELCAEVRKAQPKAK